jgi:hypothetical protein
MSKYAQQCGFERVGHRLSPKSLQEHFILIRAKFKILGTTYFTPHDLKDSFLAGCYGKMQQKNLPLESVRKTLEEAGIFSNSERFCAQTPVAIFLHFGVLELMNCAKHKNFLIVDIIDITGFGELSM